MDIKQQILDKSGSSFESMTVDIDMSDYILIEDALEIFKNLQPVADHGEFMVANSVLYFKGRPIADMRKLDSNMDELEAREALGDNTSLMGWTAEQECKEAAENGRWDETSEGSRTYYFEKDDGSEFDGE